MGQYLGGVVNVVVGFYTGNVWEMAGGVMQIVGTKTNNSDLTTAGAVVGTVAGVAGAAGAPSDAAPVADASGNYTAANAAAMGAPATAGDTAQAAAISGNAAPDALQVAAPAGGAAASAAGGTANTALGTWDNVKNALSTPTGVQITAGVIGGMGNAYGQAYAAQKTAESQQALQNQSIAFRQWQANIANTAGTGVVNAAAPMQYGTGLLGPQSTVATPVAGLPVSPNPLSPVPVPTPAGLSV